MIRNLSIILSLALGSCVSTPAPGTRPADMTALGHVQACQSHKQRAEDIDAAERFNASEGSTGTEGVHEYDVAKQHGRAAKAVDPKAPDCP